MDTKQPAVAHRPLHLKDVTPTEYHSANHRSDPSPIIMVFAILIAMAIPMIIFSVIRRLIQRAFGIDKRRARAATVLWFLSADKQ
jgi:hypothetical protein